ncbi:MAG: hypothetical protein CMD03_04625 [Flavobacteriales bacterium]|nr:hypothetical protein [Flavobacteriales bacterium]
MKKILYILLTILITSCGSNNQSPINEDDFSRSQILSNAYDNIILPAYANFNSDLNEFNNKTDIFISNINEQNLNNVRKSWAKAYMSWQGVEMFNLKKAEEITYARVTNSYPCIEELIDSKIIDSISEIGPFNATILGATGFPAIGYLIYGNDSSNTLANFTGFDSEKHIAYLNALVKNIVNNTNLVIDDWNTTRSNFVNSTSNTATSSLNVITNDFIYYFEKKVRTAKFGNPIDYFGTMQIRPDQIESYYKPELCKHLAIEAMKSVKRFYEGEYYDGSNNGVGLKEYLIDLNADNLVSSIENQFNEIDNKLNLLEDDFILELNTYNKDRIEQVFLAMQSLVTTLKSDMMVSYFGITEDYADNDGDGG